MQRALSRKNLWDGLPAPVRALAGGILGRVPPALTLGARFRHALHFVRQADRWPAERWRAYTLDRVRRIVALAAEKSPYYGDTFCQIGFAPDDLRTLEDLAELPTTTKETVRDNLDVMLTCDPRSSCVDATSTGGTGGEPLHFYIGADRSAIEYAYLVAGWERAGFRLGDRLCVLRGHPVAPSRHGLRHEYDPLLRRHFYSAFHMSDEDISGYLSHIAAVGPCFLHVYPSSAHTLARYLARTGLPAPSNVRGILAESEIVYPDQRRLAEDMFQCRYFSSYGHTEKVISGAECEHSSDYHIWPTYGYFELLDDEGRPVTTPGERGEIVGTGFINKVVPFIRYRTGDCATYVGDRCPHCGREQPIIRDIRGHRIQEFLVAGDGSLIPWTALNMHDDTFGAVRQFQFRQDRPGEATLRLVPVNGLADRDCNRIVESLNRKLSGQVLLRTEIVDAISLSHRGKAIYVDQRIPTNHATGTQLLAARSS